MNLLSETLQRMDLYGKKPADVREVTWNVLLGYVEHKRCTWDTFSKVAAKIDYDSGYGVQKIDESLVVLFNDGTWMERWEYDGSEGWEYRIPVLPMQDECTWEEDAEEIRKQLLLGA